MPMVNYCRKCKAETPLVETCPYCGGKLAKTNQQLSFGVIRTPVKDWFAWNQVLRVGLPVLGLVLVIAVVAEAVSSGTAGILALFSQGFFVTLMGVFIVMLLLTLALLLLQGPERVHFVLDKQGVHARTYLPVAQPVRLYARFLTPESVEKITDGERPPLDGLTLVRYVFLPWAQIKRVRIWREGFALLFYRPTFWQALAVRCPVGELSEAESFIRAKMKRFKKAGVWPLENEKMKKKR